MEKIDNYLVYYFSSKGYTEYKTISLEEYEKYLHAKEFVLFYHRYHELYELVKINTLEFWIYLNQIAEKHRLSFIFADYDDLADPKLYLNQKLLNILSSFRTFDDHTQHQLSLICGGKESPIYKSYSSISSTIYDEHFSYRFFYRLRNYTQHLGLPISLISFSHRGASPNCKLHFYSVIPKIKKEELLNFDGWGSIKTEINKLDDELDVRDYVNEFFHSFKLLFKELQKLLCDEYNTNKKYLDDLYNECLLQSGDPKEKYDALALLVYFKNISDDKTEFMLPKDTINRIDRFELKNILDARIKDSVTFSLNTSKIPL